MKKMITLLIAALLAVTITACSNAPTDSTSSAETSGPSSSQTSEEEHNAITDATQLLNTVWDSYGEADRFPVVGGDASEEHTNMEGPGKYGLEDTATLDAALGFPAASVDKIDDAASLMHMMNANTFTCGVYHVTDKTDLEELVSAIQENIMNRQWLCGFPDQLVIVTIDNYIVSFFGATDVTDTFQNYLTAAYPSAKVACQEPIA